MSSLLYRLGQFSTNSARIVAAAWLILLVALGGAVAAFAEGTSDNFTIPGTESQEALDALEVRFPEVSGTSAQIIILAPDGKPITHVRNDTEKLVATMRDIDQVSNVTDPFATDSQTALSDDGLAALVTVQFEVQADGLTATTMSRFEDAIETLRATGTTVEIGGGVYGIETPGVTIIEGLGVIVAFIVLLITFGSLIAAGLPLISALMGAGVSIALVTSATIVTSVSSTALFVALMMVLAVGIDYALFIVSRHREYLADGLDPVEAASRALATAGSAVVFAGLTVMIALMALSVANIPFLSVMGIAGALAVLVAVLSALTLLPALLKFAGTRIQPQKKTQGRRARNTHSQDLPRKKVSLGSRWIRTITSRPVITVAVVTFALISLAIPAKDLRLTLPDNGSAGLESTQRKAYGLTAEHFGPGLNAPILITADIITSTDPVDTVAEIAERITALDEVQAISLATPNPTADTGVIIAIGKGGPEDVSTERLIDEIRELAPHIEADYGVSIAVTGQTAIQIDISSRLGGALFPFGLLVVGLSIILLTLVFRSLIVPVIATLGYVLSVLASFGVVSATFEWGWGESLLNIARVGPVISFLPILLMGALFGLAMDYQVFLVSRVREDYVHTKDAKGAVIRGFERSHLVIIAAAIIMISVFAAFVPEGDSMIKPIAFALAVGVLIDAFLVRLTLVPATLALFGHSSWWLPRWLDQRIPAVDIEGEGIQRIVAAHNSRTPQMEASLIWVQDITIPGTPGVFFTQNPWGVAPGSITVLTGPSDSRRTAVLLALAGRVEISSGTLWVGESALPVETAKAQNMVGLIAPSIDYSPRNLGDMIGDALPRSITHAFSRKSDLDEILLVINRALDTGKSSTDTAGLPAMPTLARQLRHGTPVASLTTVEQTIVEVVCASIGNRPLLIVDAVDKLDAPDQRVTLLAALKVLVGTQWQARRLARVGPHSGLTLIVTSAQTVEANWLGIPIRFLEVVNDDGVVAAPNTPSAATKASLSTTERDI